MNSKEHMAAWARRRGSCCCASGGVDGHDLAGVDLADEVGTDHVECAGLAGNDVAGATRRLRIAVAAQAEGPDPQRITRGNQGVTGQEEQAVGTVHRGRARRRRASSRVRPVSARRGGGPSTSVSLVERELDTFPGELGADLSALMRLPLWASTTGPELAVLEPHRLGVGEGRGLPVVL